MVLGGGGWCHGVSLANDNGHDISTTDNVSRITTCIYDCSNFSATRVGGVSRPQSEGLMDCEAAWFWRLERDGVVGSAYHSPSEAM